MEPESNASLELRNISFFDNSTRTRSPPRGVNRIDAFSAELSISLYSIIFVLSVAGNVLVMLTLIKQKKMRTITNLFLLNLAVSDMLLSVLCMPFTLVAMLLRDFIFGETICILIRFFQAVSVGVSCYTLVAISLERYYAICQPLKSRRWQTLSHARRMIAGIWCFAFVLMSPIAAFQRTIPLRKGGHACREVWPSSLLEYRLDKAYSVLLAFILLLVPLVSMSGFYGLMAKRLWMTSKNSTCTESLNANGHGFNWDKKGVAKEYTTPVSSTMLQSSHHARDVTNRKRVIRMLVVIVLQYFVCWAPTYTLNTWQSIDFRSVFRNISPTTKSLILLLAYTSSFIHPITYCFMNRNFRNGFVSLFRWHKSRRQFSISLTSDV